MNIKYWNIEEITGYKPITTFYEDFSVADMYGIDAIKETYDICFNEHKDDYKYLTELVMALNWKIWEHYKSNEKYAKLYDKLWGKTDLYATRHLKGDELKYFYRTTD